MGEPRRAREVAQCDSRVDRGLHRSMLKERCSGKRLERGNTSTPASATPNYQISSRERTTSSRVKIISLIRLSISLIFTPDYAPQQYLYTQHSPNAIINGYLTSPYRRYNFKRPKICIRSPDIFFHFNFCSMLALHAKQGQDGWQRLLVFCSLG